MLFFKSMILFSEFPFDCILSLQKEYIDFLPDKFTSQPTFVQQKHW